MTLAAGVRFGPYEIQAALGAGGMGEVYRALDTKLERDIAIKAVADSLTHDPERVARFHREVQLLAALNHPHIATIHGLEEAAGTQLLVMATGRSRRGVAPGRCGRVRARSCSMCRPQGR